MTQKGFSLPAAEILAQDATEVVSQAEPLQAPLTMPKQVLQHPRGRLLGGLLALVRGRSAHHQG